MLLFACVISCVISLLNQAILCFFLHVLCHVLYHYKARLYYASFSSKNNAFLLTHYTYYPVLQLWLPWHTFNMDHIMLLMTDLHAYLLQLLVLVKLHEHCDDDQCIMNKVLAEIGFTCTHATNVVLINEM